MSKLFWFRYMIISCLQICREVVHLVPSLNQLWFKDELPSNQELPYLGIHTPLSATVGTPPCQTLSAASLRNNTGTMAPCPAYMNWGTTLRALARRKTGGPYTKVRITSSGRHLKRVIECSCITPSPHDTHAAHLFWYVSRKTYHKKHIPLSSVITHLTHAPTHATDFLPSPKGSPKQRRRFNGRTTPPRHRAYSVSQQPKLDLLTSELKKLHINCSHETSTSSNSSKSP